MPVAPSHTGPVRTALIGYGFAGRTFHAPLIRAVPGLALSVVASGDAAKVHAELPDVEVIGDPLRAIADPRVELVVIASPNDSHVALAQAALGAGKHVVVDKPFTLSLDDARELASLADECGRLLSVFQNRRWDSDFLAIRDAIDAGLVGEAMHLESRIERFRPQVRMRWREQAGPGSGLWWDLGPHLVDQALQLFGLPERVLGSFALQREGARTPDWAHVVLEHGGRRSVLHAGMLAAGGHSRFLLHGTGGSVVKPAADQQEAQLLAGVRPGDGEWGLDPDPLLLHDGSGTTRRIDAPRGDQSRYYAAVAGAVRGQAPNPVSPAQAVAVMAVLEAAIASAESGQAIAPALTDAEREAFTTG
ncbi:oxidoreductase [Marilutibacter chinensis]|uniref:Oxidoreductase n=1 Tax=Marilutibacter chinensis TaxID=2912247 RepID=A0ABS9HRC3_9GAMM|nr:oxidoreductase [Lysobacter chinensis]MCF7220682.1 oxidoreductase [Lysobacter chinensis]